MTNGNPFYVHPGTDFGPGLMGLAQTIERVGERKKAEEKEQAEKDRIDIMKKGAVKAFQSGNPDKIAEFSIQNPEISEQLTKSAKFRNEQTKENYIDSIFQAIQDPSQIPNIAANRQAFLRSQGVGPEESRETDSIAEKYSRDPEGTLKTLKSELAFMAPDKWKAYKSAIETPSETGNIEDFKHYQTLLRENPRQAPLFATQVGITKNGADDRTTAIKEFEYGEKNPKFALQQKAKENAKNIKDIKDTVFKDSMDLRKEFLAQSKEYQKVRDSYTRVVGSTKEPSPAGDLSLIFNYMKMLDPGSVVRESEFATAASTGSYGQRIQASVQRVLSGERLAPEMRRDFVEKASVLMEGMQNQHFKREQNYTGIAIKNNLSVNEVVVDITAPSEDTLPEGLTEEDIEFNIKKYGKTRNEVISRYNESKGNR